MLTIFGSLSYWKFSFLLHATVMHLHYSIFLRKCISSKLTLYIVKEIASEKTFSELPQKTLFLFRYSDLPRGQDFSLRALAGLMEEVLNRFIGGVSGRPPSRVALPSGDASARITSGVGSATSHPELHDSNGHRG